MHTPFAVAALLTCIFYAAAVSSPIMDPIPAPVEPFFPDPDGMLDVICDLCHLPMDTCAHAAV